MRKEGIRALNNQTKAAGTGIRAAGETSLYKSDYIPESLPLTIIKDMARVDSRIIAEQLGRKHKSTFELILRYKNELEQLHHLPFKTEDGYRSQGGGKAKHFALLSEDQAYFVLTLSRNNVRAVSLKLKLVQAFRHARDAAEIGKGYLPLYHELHAEVKHLAEVAHAAGSVTPERVFHMNLNKLVNNALGLSPGQRGNLTPQKRMAVISAGFIAQKAIETTLEAGGDHHDAYASAKTQVQRYASGAALLLGAQHGC